MDLDRRHAGIGKRPRQGEGRPPVAGTQIEHSPKGIPARHRIQGAQRRSVVSRSPLRQRAEYLVHDVVYGHGAHPATAASTPPVAPASHSSSFDQRRRPEALRTAMATAFFCPTSTTRRLPRVTPV